MSWELLSCGAAVVSLSFFKKSPRRCVQRPSVIRELIAQNQCTEKLRCLKITWRILKHKYVNKVAALKAFSLQLKWVLMLLCFNLHTHKSHPTGKHIKDTRMCIHTHLHACKTFAHTHTRSRRTQIYRTTHFPERSPLTPAENSSVSSVCEVSGLSQLIVWPRRGTAWGCGMWQERRRGWKTSLKGKFHLLILLDIIKCWSSLSCCSLSAVGRTRVKFRLCSIGAAL